MRLSKVYFDKRIFLFKKYIEIILWKYLTEMKSMALCQAVYNVVGE